MRNKSLLVVLVFLWTFLTLCAATSFAQSQPRITQQIDNRAYVSLPGNVRPEAATANNIRGPVANNLFLDHMLLFLQRSPEQEQAVDQFINELNEKNSPNFHKWLTPEEYGNKFGVAEEDIQQVTNWLQSYGFQINQVYPNRMVIDFSGTAGQMAIAFRTQIARLEVGGVSHIANTSDPQIPAALAPVIKGFASLNDFRPNPQHISATQYTFAGCSATTAHPTEPGTCYAVTPEDNATIYNLKPLFSAGYSGQGQTIAVIEDTDVYNYPGDWNTYRSTFGLSGYTQGSFTQLHPGSCTDPGTNADDGEAAIDVEVATGIAPSAAIQLLSCPSGTLTFGGLIALQGMLNGSGPYPGVVSVSYGVCEAFNGNGGNAAFYYTYQQAAAQGISVFTSSGDEGPSSCSSNFSAGTSYDVASLGVSGWGGTPYDVSVGGTDFEDVYLAKFNSIPISTYWNASNDANYGSAKQYVPEIPWNDACASTLIANYARGSFNTYGASGTGMCNTSPYNNANGYLIAAAGSGGASNCATGQGGANTSNYGTSQPGCQGYTKPPFQTGATLSGNHPVYGMPSDGLRDVPDVSMFAANGLWGHFETVCWSDPAYTSDGAAPCTGLPSTWSGFGGTSVSAPTMAAMQVLVNQKTSQSWGNPLSYYYQIGQNEYGTAGGSFLGTSCNASGTGGPGSGCVFNDVTQGDIDVACRYNGTTTEHHCYKPSTNGVDSTDNVTGATVINGGTGYTTAPTCTIAGPTNSQPYKSPTGTTLWAGGMQATCTAAVTAGTTNAVWTVAMLSTSGVGSQVVLSNNGGTTTCGPYTLSGTSTTLMATNLVSSIGSGCALATATSSTSTVTITARNAGYAGNFTTTYGNNGDLFNAFYVAITNTTKGQGPNYVSGISIGTAGIGYAPETPITLTGVGTGAIAVANTTPGTASQSYQPTYGAASGYDLATGLGTPNAYNLVYSSVWGPTQQSQTITFPNPGPLTYGTSPVTLTATATSGLQVTYTVISGPATVNGSVLTITGAGNVVVEADQAGNSSWLPAPPVTDTIVVNPAPLTVTANAASMTYGNSLPTFSASYSGFVNGDGQGVLTGSPSLTTTATSTSPVGTYPITASQGSLMAANYSFVFVSGVLTINQRNASVTPNAASKTYGDSDPTLTGTLSGFLPSDGVTATYTRTAGENVGNYPISATLNPPGVLGNYNIAYNTANFVINQRNASVTPNAASKTYGDSDPTLTGTLSGFLPSDGVTATYTRTAGENVGNYPISATLSPPGVLGNYNITYNTANFVINQRNASVTPNAASKTYGDSDPTLTGTLSGFLPSDGVTATYTRTAGENVGNYPISATLNPPGVLGNYNITYNTANFVINQRNASVTPNAASKTYGDSDPTLTGTLNGFLPSDGVTATYTRTAGENVGNYPISATLNPPGVLSNYNVTYNTATFAISQALLTVTADNKTMPDGGPLPLLTASYSGFKNGDNQSVLSGSPNLTTTATTNSPPGAYPINAAQGSLMAANYTFVFVNGTLTVTPVTAVITTPVKGSQFGTSNVTIGWSKQSLATSYRLYVGSTPGAYDIAALLTPNLSLSVPNVPTDGRAIYVTLFGNGTGSYVLQDTATYTAANIVKAVITGPTKGSQLTSSTAAFTWSAETGGNPPVSTYTLYVGSTPGAYDIAAFQTSNLTLTVANIPTDGRTIYVTLYGNAGGVRTQQDTATYTAPSTAGITTPVKGSQLGSSNATFGWTAQTGATSYRLYVGSTPGAYDIAALLTPNLSLPVSNIPTDGRAIYVTLFGNAGGSYKQQDTATYTAANIVKAVITAPTKGSQLGSGSATFTWSAETGGNPPVSTYTLYVGSTPGAYDIAAFQTSNLSLTVSTIPTDGRQIYVTLYGNAGGVRTQQDSATYTAANIVKAVITSPAKGSQFHSNYVTFTWTPETGGNPPDSLYRLYVGSTPGAYDLAAVQVSGTSVLIGNLPTDGRTVYVTLYGNAGGSYTVQDTAIYTALGISR